MKAKRKPRKHHPEYLRAKRAARALNLPWSAVIRERNRLRQNEIDQRGHEDEARQTAWGLWLKLAGWSDTHRPYWRSGFARVFRKRIAAGADYDSIPHSDVVAESVRCNCPEYSEWSTDDIWSLLLSDYPQLRDVHEYYDLALCRLAAGRLPASEVAAVEFSETETPF